jgi:serine protease Do/serine protease DegQ
MARAVMQQIIRFGEVKRGRLGVGMQDLTPELAKTLGATIRSGVALSNVVPESPAAKAGLRVGDIVTSINGRAVRGSAELRAQLGVIPVGDTVDLRVQRGPESRQVRVQIAPVEAAATGTGVALQQLTGASVTNAERQTDKGKEPVVYVTKVEPGSPAFRNGLRAGDVILGLNRKRVANTTELVDALRTTDRVALHVLRGDIQLTIVVR